ncbi:MAG: hypothetical protein KGL39_36150 [Patescibacteria group bacterium]|nr:hypothetical protein [Patescibacteria group bacterium]
MTDEKEIRGKFEVWYKETAPKHQPPGSLNCSLQWEAWLAGYQSRQPEIDALNRALRASKTIIEGRDRKIMSMSDYEEAKKSLDSEREANAKMTDEIDALREENSRLLAANRDCIQHFEELKHDYETLEAQLAWHEAGEELALAKLLKLQKRVDELERKE